MNETEAKFSRIGWREGFFAFRGNKVLCDRLVRVRRFKTEASAIKAGQAAKDEDFH